MKLHPFNVVLFVAQSHDQPVARFGGDLQLVRNAVAFDDERVVARRLERIGESGEHARIGVGDHRGLAVHYLGGTNDRSAEHLTDALMPEADTKQRALARRVFDQCIGDASVGGSAGTRADEDAVWFERVYAFEVDLVIAANDRRCAELPDVLDEVVYEGVVVVDDKDRRHGDQR